MRERRPTVQFTANPQSKKVDRNARRQPSERRGAGYKLSAEEQDLEDEESDKKGQASKKPWSQEEDEMVSRSVANSPLICVCAVRKVNFFRHLGKAMSSSRSSRHRMPPKHARECGVQCLHRLLLPCLERLGPGSATRACALLRKQQIAKADDETPTLPRRLIAEFGLQRWRYIASFVRGRSGKQVRERWRNQLDPCLNKDTFKSEEDEIIVSSWLKFGNREPQHPPSPPSDAGSRSRVMRSRVMRSILPDSMTATKMMMPPGRLDSDLFPLCPETNRVV